MKNSAESKCSFRGKPYNFFGDYLAEKYQTRVLKLPVNVNFSCPNRDGTLGYGGCVFCSEDGSASPSPAGLSVKEQMQSAAENFKRSDSRTKFIVYFQAYTNTYSDVSSLRKIYSEAVNSSPRITGLMIGTRPDCLADSTLDMIAEFKKENFELMLEIGMQSMHESSLKFLNRRHTHTDTRSAIERAAARGIPVCVHVILGIPGESWEDMMSTAEEISSLPVSGVKFHQLHVISGTALEKIYYEKKFRLPSMNEYASITADFIERLRPDILIHRLSADRGEDTLIAPLWGHHKGTVINAIEDKFKSRGTWQGFLWNNSCENDN